MRSTLSQYHPSIARERVDKALSSLYLGGADTNLRKICEGAVAPVTALSAIALPPATLKNGVEGDRPLFQDAVSGKLDLFDAIAPGHRFGPTWASAWVRVQLVVPADWAALLAAGKAQAFFVWDSSCEAAVYDSSGKITQGLTGGDADSYRGNRRAELLLPPDAFPPGESRELFVEVAANGLFGMGAGTMISPPDPAATFALARCELVLRDELAHQLFWHFVVAKDLGEHAPKGSALAERAVQVANAMLNVVDRRDRSTFAAAIALAERHLLLPAPAASPSLIAALHPLTPVVFAMGHCHIDSAWLWPFAETRRKVARSWASQLRYMARHDADFVFAASQAAQWAMLCEDHPDLADGPLRAAVAAGRFVPVGGAWVEPDGNMPSGESFVRQLLLGCRYVSGRFGREIAAAERLRAAAAGVPPPARVPHGDGVAWLPDTFGYSPALPQLYRQAGLRYFLTQKLSWSLLNKPEHSTFAWRGLDGSAVLTHFPPADDYNAQADVAAVLKSAAGNKDASRWASSAMLYGNGDGGGGPNLPMFEQLRRLGAVPATEIASSATPGAAATAEIPAPAMAATGGAGSVAASAAIVPLPSTASCVASTDIHVKPAARDSTRYQRMPGMPAVVHASPRQFFDALASEVGASPWGLPEWCGELYLELHQGTLTSQAACKKANRQCEVALQETEALTTIAALCSAAPAPAAGLDEASLRQTLGACWRDVLMCQFHDVLPGSSIKQVYIDSAAMHAAVLGRLQQLQQQAQAALLPASAASELAASATEGGAAVSAACSAAASVLAADSLSVWNMSAAPRVELLRVPAPAACGAGRKALVPASLSPFSVSAVPVPTLSEAVVQLVADVPPLLAHRTLPESAAVALPAVALRSAGGLSLPDAADAATPVRVTIVPAGQPLGQAGGATASTEHLQVDNGVLRVSVCARSGRISSLLDLRPPLPREVIEQCERPSPAEAAAAAAASSASGAAAVAAAAHGGAAGSRRLSRIAGGNRLVAYSDVPFYWDAWDTMPYHLEKGRVVAPAPAAEPAAAVGTAAEPAAAGSASPSPGGAAAGPSREPDSAGHVEVLEAGPLRAVLRLTLPRIALFDAPTHAGATLLGSAASLDAAASTDSASPPSWLQQDIIIERGSPLIRFETAVAWHASHTLLKVEFPLAAGHTGAATATYEVAYGCVERPAHTNTPRDMMQYEVCGHRWADLSGPHGGVALLNDCKYGHSVRDGVLSLSLLRAPKAPDDTADMGTYHRFTYALLPHEGGARAVDSDLVWRGIALNSPLTVAPAPMPAVLAASAPPSETAGVDASVRACHSFFRVTEPRKRGGDASAAGPPQLSRNVIISAVKLPEAPLFDAAESGAHGGVAADALAGGAGGAGGAGAPLSASAAGGFGSPSAPSRQSTSIVVRMYEALGHDSAATVHVRLPARMCAAAGSPVLWRIAAVKGVNILEEQPGQEGIPVGEADAEAPADAGPVSAGAGAGAPAPCGDLVADCAPPLVRAAFARLPSPVSAGAALSSSDAHSFDIRMRPFQVATFVVELEAP